MVDCGGDGERRGLSGINALLTVMVADNVAPNEEGTRLCEITHILPHLCSRVDDEKTTSQFALAPSRLGLLNAVRCMGGIFKFIRSHVPLVASFTLLSLSHRI